MNFSLPKKLGTPLKSISACMSSSSKSINHYQTLDVDHDATQEEIKTAYYKLTKKFHPDVNKTEEAKDKFRAISDAYEIIGNYKARKQYDRGMFARGTTHRSTGTNEKDPEHMAFYKSRMDAYRKPVRTADSKVYDFDAWTRAHYGDTLKRTIKRKHTNINVELTRIYMRKKKVQESNELKFVFGFFITIVIAILFLESDVNFDNVVEKNSEKSKEESEQ